MTVRSRPASQTFANSVQVAEVPSQAIHLVIHDLLDDLLDNCPLDVAILISRMSRWFRNYVQQYILRRVNSMLGAWVDDPWLLRSMMRLTRSVVSGSSILSFVVGGCWEPEDLDIWTPQGHHDQMVNYLVQAEGYNITHHFAFIDNVPASDPGQYYPGHAVKRVTKLHRSQQGSTPISKAVKVDVIESVSEFSISPIFDFHSSVVMNWLTADTIVVTDPANTFAYRAVVNNRGPRDATRESVWRAKYAARGFRLISPQSIADVTLRSTWDPANLRYKFDNTDHCRDDLNPIMYWSLWI